MADFYGGILGQVGGWNAADNDAISYAEMLRLKAQRERAMRALSGYAKPAADAVSNAWDYTMRLPETTRQQGQEYLTQRGYSEADAARLAGTASRGVARPVAAVDFLTPQTPADFAFMAAGPAARVGARAGKAALALGGGLLGFEPDEAEAGAGSAGKAAKNMAKRAADAVMNPRAVIGGNSGARPRAPVTDEGLAIKGAEYDKAAKQVMDEIRREAPGVGPLDLASAKGVPNVPQTAMQRYAPPRGVSGRLQRALENQDVLDGMRESIRAGMKMGAHQWYHSEPIREAFVKELGPQEGMARFKKFMDYVAATSPRSDVPTNIRNASYYYTKDGAELPDALPFPYGHVAQNLHRQNVGTIQGAGWDIFKNPKPPSFSENLMGNLEPVTVDTHAFRNIGMRTKDPEFLETSISVPYKSGKALEKLDEGERELLNMAQRYGELSPDGKKVIFRPQKLFAEGKLSMDDALKIPTFWSSKPNANEYAAAEDLYRTLAKEFNLAPADAQAAAWAGAGTLTGLKSPPTRTFPQLFNERVEYTSRMRGEAPQQTLSMMIRGQKPLLSTVPFGLAVPGLLGGGEQTEPWQQ